MDKHPTPKAPDTPSTAEVQGQPKNVFEQINKYGTYNIQPTADVDNDYPAIAQGCPKAVIKREKAVPQEGKTGHPYPKKGTDPVDKKLFR